MTEARRVLITGGSGYLGQFLVDRLSRTHAVAFTYLTQQVPVPPGVTAFQADLATGHGLLPAVLAFKPAVVINCAALSQPAACERDYQACRALNVPVKLIEALLELKQQAGGAAADALLIHISTDQVYDGSRPWWSEADPTQPCNAYGRSKLEAEQALQALYPGRFVSLRASLIYGPQPPLAPVKRPLFVQFVVQVLRAEGRETSFFVDEFRCPIFVDDIVAITSLIIQRCEPAAAAGTAQQSDDAGRCWLAGLPHSCYNMGGPERLSREDMALAVARHCKLSTSLVKQARTADVQRGYNSPPDISMVMDRLLRDLPGVRLTPFAEALLKIFPDG